VTKTIEVDFSRQMNFYINTSVILIGFLAILYIMRKNSRNVRDVDNYDWSRFNISTYGVKTKAKKTDKKEKNKQRVKEYSKGTGFIKEENKFQPIQSQKEKESFLNLEESSNLQDLINFAASRVETETKDLPVESLYTQILNNNQPKKYATDINLDSVLSNIISSRISSDKDKINQLLEAYGELLKRQNKSLSEKTYLSMIELFIKNGNLEYASYFLCQMDRLKLKIPRACLDLFLDSNIAKKAFENKKEKVEKKFNKFDVEKQGQVQSFPEYEYYSQNRNNYKKSNVDLPGLFTKLKLDAKPFIPKVDAELSEMLQSIDPSNVKEFIPKNYKVVQSS
jgi:pentatricopeptide repeat protein